MRSHTHMDSPIGTLTLVATDDTLSGVYMVDHRHQPPAATFGEPDPAAFTEVITQLTEYFAGTRTEFDVPLHLHGTDFQRRVWTELRAIPYGETTTYGELARRIGSPLSASRAVGLANGKNPVSIIVPCHRVVGSTGHLTGYAGGLDRKHHLLDLERRTTSPDLFTSPV